MKTKKTKNKKSSIQIEWDAGIYFGGILAITFLVAYSCVFFSISLIKNGHYYCYSPAVENSRQNSIVVKTDKDNYNKNERISFSVVNNSDEPIYVEPCEQLINYEGWRWKIQNGRKIIARRGLIKMKRKLFAMSILLKRKGGLEWRQAFITDAKKRTKNFAESQKSFILMNLR